MVKSRFPPRYDDPIGGIGTRDLLHLGHPSFLFIREINVSLKLRRSEGNLQPLREELSESVNEVEGVLIAVMDEGRVALDDLDIGGVLVQPSNVWIAFPKLASRSPDISNVLTWMSLVQIS